jgi:hypothetical protein
MPCVRTRVLAAALLCFCGAAHAQHVQLSAGGGLGTFITGGAGIDEPNAHRILIATVALPGDFIELGALKGTLERSRGIPANVGDDDLDYRGFEVVVTRSATRLPVDLSLGAVRYEETYHLGYPHQDLGGQQFVHRWGPQLSALRSWQMLHFGRLWVAATLNYAPYQPRQVVLFLDAGVGLRVP